MPVSKFTACTVAFSSPRVFVRTPPARAYPLDLWGGRGGGWKGVCRVVARGVNQQPPKVPATLPRSTPALATRCVGPHSLAEDVGDVGVPEHLNQIVAHRAVFLQHPACVCGDGPWAGRGVK